MVWYDEFFKEMGGKRGGWGCYRGNSSTTIYNAQCYEQSSKRYTFTETESNKT
jgi:hypothetical protein